MYYFPIKFSLNFQDLEISGTPLGTWYLLPFTLPPVLPASLALNFTTIFNSVWSSVFGVFHCLRWDIFLCVCVGRGERGCYTPPHFIARRMSNGASFWTCTWGMGANLVFLDDFCIVLSFLFKCFIGILLVLYHLIMWKLLTCFQIRTFYFSPFKFSSECSTKLYLSLTW